MTKKRMEWEEGNWINSPLYARKEGDFLKVAPEKGRDFWKKTLYGFEFEDGSALLSDWNNNTAVEVSFQLASFTELYDQAGILLYNGPEQWIKAGIEINDGIPQLSTVVTAGYSDWSLAAVPEWVGEEVTLRASIIKDAVVIRARTENHGWRTIRVARFPYTTGNQAGPYTCSPTREGFEVTFTRWHFTERDQDLHSDPPVEHH
ncbi:MULTISPECIES: DUF1349 domain-containing protein [Paenibacillus]|uniref:DUF1349 domain-containing protein n=1 Tax=Paenibacillus ottowii TaxID=2315729 RepID=A0ABY3AY17_9BACL|nr:MULTISPECIES: DUF1349 domain-containing protein [Paenibacillus]KZE72044.1 hypothetical protein AV545_16515 [Paenibacillus jamilae]TQR94404.1 DUF1349 domain-containing protein [Paenibacillus ottowii]